MPVTCPHCGRENSRSNEYCRGEYCSRPIHGDMISRKDKKEFIKFMNNLEDGDKVVWNSRKEPLEVTYHNKEGGELFIGFESKRGKTYTAVQNKHTSTRFVVSTKAGAMHGNQEEIKWIKKVEE